MVWLLIMTKNSRVFDKTCLYCGKDYIAAKPFGKFCADKCRVYYSQNKKAFNLNVHEQLPALLVKIKDESKTLAGNKGKVEQELERAISVILKAHSKLNTKEVQLSSFDDYLSGINQRKTNTNPSPLKNEREIQPLILKEDKMMNVPTITAMKPIPKTFDGIKERFKTTEIIPPEKDEVTKKEVSTSENKSTGTKIELKAESFPLETNSQKEDSKLVSKENESESQLNPPAIKEESGELDTDAESAKAWVLKYLKKGFDNTIE